MNDKSFPRGAFGHHYKAFDDVLAVLADEHKVLEARWFAKAEVPPHSAELIFHFWSRERFPHYMIIERPDGLPPPMPWLKGLVIWFKRIQRSSPTRHDVAVRFSDPQDAVTAKILFNTLDPK